MMYNSESLSMRRDRLPQQLSGVNLLGISDINLQKIFQNIDTLIPLECCVYYQIIPLYLTDCCLDLGIVNPEDTAAIDYINLMTKYLKYSLRLQPIEAQKHEIILSTYLKYCQEKENQKKITSAADRDFAPTIIEQPKNNQHSSQSSFDSRQILRTEKTTSNRDETPIIKTNTSRFSSKDDKPQQPMELSAQNIIAEDLIIESSPQISAQQLSKKILVEILQSESGSLGFERHDNYGKIICSQEGANQSSINKLSIKLFQETIDEFKSLVNFPKIDIGKSQKVEIEKTYKQARILLHLQLVNSAEGEEGTLHVLRGKALESYKQKKLQQTSKQILDLARKLERKIYQVHTYSDDRTLYSESLVAIQTITQEISQHLN